MLTDPDIRRDLLAYCRGPLDKPAPVADTEALRQFQGDVLVLWSPDNRAMPPAHGRALAALIPHARYAEIPGAYVLSPLDEPEAVAREMSQFLTSAPTATEPRSKQAVAHAPPLVPGSARATHLAGKPGAAGSAGLEPVLQPVPLQNLASRP